MFQVLRNTRSATFAPGNTNAMRLPDLPARMVYLQAPTGNAGTVTVLGVDPATGIADAAGVVLAAGGTFGPWWAENLSQLAYQLSSAGDSVKVIRGF